MDICPVLPRRAAARSISETGILEFLHGEEACVPRTGKKHVFPILGSLIVSPEARGCAGLELGGTWRPDVSLSS